MAEHGDRGDGQRQEDMSKAKPYEPKGGTDKGGGKHGKDDPGGKK